MFSIHENSKAQNPEAMPEQLDMGKRIAPPAFQLNATGNPVPPGDPKGKPIQRNVSIFRDNTHQGLDFEYDTAFYNKGGDEASNSSAYDANQSSVEKGDAQTKHVWEFAKVLDQKVQAAYAYIMKNPEIPGFQDLDGHTQEWIKLMKQGKKLTGREPFLAAKLGYVVESIACVMLNATYSQHSLTTQVKQQGRREGTRPDVILANGKTDLAWLDITANESAGHIGRKAGGWKNPRDARFAVEVVYPSLPTTKYPELQALAKEHGVGKGNANALVDREQLAEKLKEAFNSSADILAEIDAAKALLKKKREWWKLNFDFLKGIFKEVVDGAPAFGVSKNYKPTADSIASKYRSRKQRMQVRQDDKIGNRSDSELLLHIYFPLTRELLKFQGCQINMVGPEQNKLFFGASGINDSELPRIFSRNNLDPEFLAVARLLPSIIMAMGGNPSSFQLTGASINTGEGEAWLDEYMPVVQDSSGAVDTSDPSPTITGVSTGAGVTSGTNSNVNNAYRPSDTGLRNPNEESKASDNSQYGSHQNQDDFSGDFGISQMNDQQLNQPKQLVYALEDLSPLKNSFMGKFYVVSNNIKIIISGSIAMPGMLVFNSDDSDYYPLPAGQLLQFRDAMGKVVFSNGALELRRVDQDPPAPIDFRAIREQIQHQRKSGHSGHGSHTKHVNSSQVQGYGMNHSNSHNNIPSNPSLISSSLPNNGNGHLMTSHAPLNYHSPAPTGPVSYANNFSQVSNPYGHPGTAYSTYPSTTSSHSTPNHKHLQSSQTNSHSHSNNFNYNNNVNVAPQNNFTMLQSQMGGNQSNNIVSGTHNRGTIIHTNTINSHTQVNQGRQGQFNSGTVNGSNSMAFDSSGMNGNSGAYRMAPINSATPQSGANNVNIQHVQHNNLLTSNNAMVNHHNSNNNMRLNPMPDPNVAQSTFNRQPAPLSFPAVNNSGFNNQYPNGNINVNNNGNFNGNNNNGNMVHHSVSSSANVNGMNQRFASSSHPVGNNPMRIPLNGNNSRHNINSITPSTSTNTNSHSQQGQPTIVVNSSTTNNLNPNGTNGINMSQPPNTTALNQHVNMQAQGLAAVPMSSPMPNNNNAFGASRSGAHTGSRWNPVNGTTRMPPSNAYGNNRSILTPPSFSITAHATTTHRAASNVLNLSTTQRSRWIFGPVMGKQGVEYSLENLDTRDRYSLKLGQEVRFSDCRTKVKNEQGLIVLGVIGNS